MSQSQLGRSKLKITIGSGVNRVEFSGEAAPLLHRMNWSVKDVMIQFWEEQGMTKFVILEIIWRTFLHVYLAYGAHLRLTDYEASAPPRATLLLLAPVG